MDTLALMSIGQNTSSAIADKLRARITTGQLCPGSALRQELLASELGVSRMPIRDALQKLHSEGLVVLHPNRGMFVAAMTDAECAEIFDLRATLEPMALRAAVPNHTGSSLRKLNHLQDELEHANGVTEWADGDRKFHECLYAPCGRSRTIQFVGLLREAVQRFYLAEMSPTNRKTGWAREHRQILNAVAAGDSELACKYLLEHLQETERVVQARLADLSDE